MMSRMRSRFREYSLRGDMLVSGERGEAEVAIWDVKSAPPDDGVYAAVVGGGG